MANLRLNRNFTAQIILFFFYGLMGVLRRKRFYGIGVLQHNEKLGIQILLVPPAQRWLQYPLYITIAVVHQAFVVSRFHFI